MPTIEIASINSVGLNLKQVDFTLAIIEENKIESHRGLFYELLRNENGVIIHLGNPDFKYDKEHGFHAGQIIDWNFVPVNGIVPTVDPNDPEYDSLISQQFEFKFKKRYKMDINKLMNLALAGSKINKIYFLSDYQFGPVESSKECVPSINAFWDIHDYNGLIFNRIYEIIQQ